jgi:hypothetical protein
LTQASGKDQEPSTPYQAGYAFGDQYRKGPGGAAHSPPHPISTNYLVFVGEAMWTGGAECGRLGFSFGTFDGVRFKKGFVAGLYGRASEEDLVAEIYRAPVWTPRRRPELGQHLRDDYGDD